MRHCVPALAHFDGNQNTGVVEFAGDDEDARLCAAARVFRRRRTAAAAAAAVAAAAAATPRARGRGARRHGDGVVRHFDLLQIKLELFVHRALRASTARAASLAFDAERNLIDPQRQYRLTLDLLEEPIARHPLPREADSRVAHLDSRLELTDDDGAVQQLLAPRSAPPLPPALAPPTPRVRAAIRRETKARTRRAPGAPGAPRSQRARHRAHGAHGAPADGVGPGASCKRSPAATTSAGVASHAPTAHGAPRARGQEVAPRANNIGALLFLAVQAPQIIVEPHDALQLALERPHAIELGRGVSPCHRRRRLELHARKLVLDELREVNDGHRAGPGAGPGVGEDIQRDRAQLAL